MTSLEPPDGPPATAPNCLFDELWSEQPLYAGRGSTMATNDTRRRDLFLRVSDGGSTTQFFDDEEQAEFALQATGANSVSDIVIDYGIMCQIERNAGGASVEDYDGDGWPDVVLSRMTSGDGAPTLLRNRGNGSFEDVSERSGLTAPWKAGDAGGMAHHAAGRSNGFAFFDCDNDGDADLFVTTLAGTQHYLMVNDGAGHFEDQAALRGVAVLGGSGGAASVAWAVRTAGTGVAVGDYDGAPSHTTHTPTLARRRPAHRTRTPALLLLLLLLS